MKATVLETGNIHILSNQGKSLGLLCLEDDVSEGDRRRFLEILNDVEGVEVGNLRGAMLPLFLEMHRQKIDSVNIDRTGGMARVAIRLEGQSEPVRLG